MNQVKNKYRGSTTCFRVIAELFRAAHYHGLTTYQEIAVKFAVIIMRVKPRDSFLAEEAGHLLGKIQGKLLRYYFPIFDLCY